MAVTYAPTGEVETKTDARGTTTYAYDLLGRLVKQTHPDGSQLAWAYDPNGRLAQQAHLKTATLAVIAAKMCFHA